MKIKINASVMGATGYAGEELMRLLCSHPNVKINSAVSKSFGGKQMSDVYGSYLKNDIALDADYSKINKNNTDVVFLGLPHGESIKITPLFIERGIKVIDLSGDFRYADTKIYEDWYGIEHTQKELNKKAVYGLPEFYKDEIKTADFVANPGCYTTTSILALAPLLKDALIDAEGVIIDAKSGVTGAGRKESLAYSFCETDENFKAYSVPKHRHTSEIEEQLSIISGKKITLLFTPQLLPVKRGIFASIYAKISKENIENAVKDSYASAYNSAVFTHVLPKGKLPELKFVTGSNNCIIGYEISERTNQIIIFSCTDNLIKGAAGQAIQNMNIMFDLKEDTGLSKIGRYL